MRNIMVSSRPKILARVYAKDRSRGGICGPLEGPNAAAVVGGGDMGNKAGRCAAARVVGGLG